MKLPFAEAWDKYQVHPERATPHAVSEQRAYRITFDEFVRFATEEYSINRNAKRPVTSISEVTPHLCEAFAAYLKTTMLAVDTHNRIIKRLRKIFDCLKDYYEGENPFRSKTLLRSEREERGTVVHRRAFTKEQEEDLLTVLADSEHKLMNDKLDNVRRRVTSKLDSMERKHLKDLRFIFLKNEEDIPENNQSLLHNLRGITCPMRYYFRFIEHAEVERTSISIPFGRAFHLVLRDRALKGTAYAIVDAKEDFAVYFKGETEVCENLTYKQDEDYWFWDKRGCDMFDVALADWPDDYTVKIYAPYFSKKHHSNGTVRPGDSGFLLEQVRNEIRQIRRLLYSAVQRVNETSSAGDRLIASTKIQAKE